MQLRTRSEDPPAPAEIPGPPPVSRERGPQARAFAASALLHAALLLVFAYALPRPLSVAPPPVESLSVELLTEAEIAALTKSEEPPEVPLPSPAPAPIPPAEAPLVLSHARTLFSDRALSRSARASLATLALDARFEQLCDVEAMEQIARSKKEFRPERAVAYATADAKVAGNLMTADGAAFLSEGHWYRLSFRCETTPDRRKVVSFDFATGGPITEGRGLGDGAAD